MVTGPAAAVTGQLLGFVKLGFTALSLTVDGPGEDEQVDRLAREVILAVRAGAWRGHQTGRHDFHRERLVGPERHVPFHVGAASR